MKKFRKILLMVAAFGSLMTAPVDISAAGTSQLESDAKQHISESEALDMVRGRIKEAYFKTKPNKQAEEWSRTLGADGRWADVDYKDKSRADWQTVKHLDRTINIARLNPKDPVAILALRQWLKGKYRNPNWWYQSVAVPQRYLELAYLIDDNLPKGLRDTLNRELEVYAPSEINGRQGGSRIKELGNYAKVQLWRRDTEGVTKLFSEIEAEAAYAPLEDVMLDYQGNLDLRNDYRPAGRGFQSDMTFHHRGDRVDCTLTYGMAIPDYFNYWNNRLKGTPWEFSQKSRDFVRRFMDEPVRWHMVRDKYCEPGAYERDLARPVKSPLNYKFTDKTQLSGARYFPQSAYFAFKRPRYESAVMFHSERNSNQEMAHNSEGIHNHYRGDGACHLSVTGEEYLNIWPLFDFRKVPGVTSPLTPYSEMTEKSVQLRQSDIEFAGAVTDSVFGAVALDFSTKRSDLRARKSWFFFDEGYVCLGTGINCTKGDTIVTTVEQSLSPVDTYTRRNGWIVHNGNSYKVIEGKAETDLSRRKGTWANCVKGVSYANQEAEGNIFSIVIDHGVDPRDARYAYAVAPGAEAPEDWFRILRQDNTAHAVESADGKVIYATFFEPGSVKTSQGTLSVSQPCMAMFRGEEIYFSDPTHKRYSMKASLERNGKTRNFNIKVPTWQKAGTSVKMALD